MDGRQKPDAQSDSANDLNNEEIIDLKQVAQEGNDEEIIDLTNVLDQPDKEPDALKETTNRLSDTDDAVIDLEEPLSEADTGEEAATSPQKVDDDDIIDLADMETTLEADISASALDKDEDVIDLMETVEPEVPVTEADDMDETMDLESGAEITMTDTIETTEAPEFSLSEEPSPASGEDQNLTLAADENADDEEIIDLADMETAIEADGPNSGIEDSKDEEEEEEEEIIDLLDTVALETRAAEVDDTVGHVPPEETLETDMPDSEKEPNISTTEKSAPMAEENQETRLPDENADDDEIIDLAEMGTAIEPNISDNAEEDSEEDEVIDLVDSVVPETPIVEDIPDDTLEEGLSPTAPSEPSTDTTVPLTEQELEAALERTIRKIYAEKIEHLMIQTIEKTVQREIEKIKQALMENDDDASD